MSSRLKAGGNEALRQAAREAALRRIDLRNAVRELVLEPLKSRALSLSRIKQVLGAVVEGVSQGLAASGAQQKRALYDAMTGMDEALEISARAIALALEQVIAGGLELNATALNRAFEALAGLNGEFLKTVQQAANASSEGVSDGWHEILNHVRIAGTGTGESVARSVEKLKNRGFCASPDGGAIGFTTSRTSARYVGTLASGVLIGLSERLEPGGQHRRKFHY
jgi:hypothetical protein